MAIIIGVDVSRVQDCHTDGPGNQRHLGQSLKWLITKDMPGQHSIGETVGPAGVLTDENNSANATDKLWQRLRLLFVLTENSV